MTENDNPWKMLSHDLYEKHMGHENVQQLQTLSHILCEQFNLVSDIQNPTLAILGITGGNGLENIKAGRYKSVIGIDINKEYLEICGKRYGYLPELELYQIDLMTEKERAVNIIKNADLVTANLLIIHIHLNNFIEIINKLHKPIISVTVQFNPDGQLLSNSGYEFAFDNIQEHGNNHNETELNEAMYDSGYVLINRFIYDLPNKKVFIRLDYKRREQKDKI